MPIAEYMDPMYEPIGRAVASCALLEWQMADTLRAILNHEPSWFLASGLSVDQLATALRKAAVAAGWVRVPPLVDRASGLMQTRNDIVHGLFLPDEHYKYAAEVARRRRWLSAHERRPLTRGDVEVFAARVMQLIDDIEVEETEIMKANGLAF